MNRFLRYALPGLFLAALVLGTRVSAGGPGFVETDLVVNKEVDGVPTLMDSNGIVHIAKFSDSNLVNPWGLGESGSSPFWVSDNGSSLSTLYNTSGSPLSLVVDIPSPGDPLGASGTPTGLVFNIAGGADGQFKITGVDSGGMATTQSAVFLFAAEDGTILGWNSNVNPAGTPAATLGRHAIIAVNNSGSAIYKGLAIATDSAGKTLLYATNFGAGRIDVFGGDFQPASGLPTDAFVDPKLPRGFAPFNVVAITMDGATELFVTYALKEPGGTDDVSGQGHGIVDTYDLHGNFVARFSQHGQLDSPWGVALAPAGFGQFGGKLLIGNFGNGHINVFDPATGEFLDKLRNPHGQAIVIDGLWALRFGNGGSGGHPGTLYFTAGPNDEHDGLFGSLDPE